MLKNKIDNVLFCWMGLVFFGILMISTQVRAGIDTGLSGDEYAAGPFPIGFSFNYYGKNFNNFYVSTNGKLGFSPISIDGYSYCLPGELNSLSVFWDDLITNVGGSNGKIYYETIGEAPNRQLIVQWTDMYFFYSYSFLGTFQLILYEGGNQIKFQYPYLSENLMSYGAYATIGISGSDSSQFIQIGCNQPNIISAHQAITFTPSVDGYLVDRNGYYGFIDISGKTPQIPVVNKRYANTAPIWNWGSIPSVNSYEVEVQTYSDSDPNLSQVVHREIIGNVTQFLAGFTMEDGVLYRSRIRGSSDNGLNWGNWSEFSEVVMFDKTLPEISINSEIRQGQQHSFIHVNYTATDPLSGISSAELQISNDPLFSGNFDKIPLSGNGDETVTYSYDGPDIDAGEELYIRVVATDRAGNTSIESSSIENAAPLQANFRMNPEGGEIPLTIEFINTTIDTAQTKYDWYFSNNMSSSQKNLTYTFRDPGTYEVTLSAVTGQIVTRKTKNFVVYPDTTAPTIDSVLFNQTTVIDEVILSETGVLSFHVVDANGLGSVTADISGESIAVANLLPDVYQITLVPDNYSRRDYVININVMDRYGNKNKLPIPLKIQTKPLAPVIIAPVKNSVVSSSLVTVMGTASRAEQVQLYLSNQEVGELVAVDSNGNFSGSLTLSSEGSYLLNAKARNVYGISDFGDIVSFSYITDKPNINFIVPSANAILTANTNNIELNASAADGISKVEIFLGDQSLAVLTQTPYIWPWSIDSLPDGSYILKAIVTSMSGKTAIATQAVSVSTAPKVSFTTPALNEILSANTEIQVTASAVEGIAKVDLSVNNQPLATLTQAPYSMLWDIGGLSDGIYTLKASATGVNGKTTVANRQVIIETAPKINFTAPMVNAVISTNTTLAVNASAADGISKVEFFVNNQSIAIVNQAPYTTLFDIAAFADGAYTLKAVATSNSGKTATTTRQVTVATAVTVNITTPAPNAILTNNATINVTASAPNGITRVELLVNDQPLTILNQAPYSTAWDISSLTDGVYTLKAVAVSESGKTATVTRQVTIQKTPPTPEIPPTPYTGTITAITPSISFGATPVVITGTAVVRDSAQLMPNATLVIILNIDGFKRRIAIASDAQGLYRYEFVPQINDNGTYIVSVVHPDETVFTEQGRFTINRLSFSPSSYNLNATRNFPSSITINAKASKGTGATGVRWVAQAADQPSGSLPAGISINPGAAVDIAAGATVPMVVQFTGSGNLGETGSVVLTAYANESGATPRGRFTLNYRINDAYPSLFATPTYIETGVQQQGSVTETLTIGNRGLVAARNVQVKLVDAQGNSPPAWVFLSSGSNLGAIDVGATIPIQITASPGSDVSDGIYNYRLIVTADNQGNGTIPVSIAVTQSGQGGVLFSVSDMFTDTLDVNGNSIQGVAGARIRLQNEAVLTYTTTLTTDAQGRASIANLPPGTYLYRASADRHTDKSGRIFVRPGITISEHIHLSYQTVSVEFSVVETTIQDQYDVVLDATYQTQVPAPVVLLEPMAVNLPSLQVGEVFTGELTLTNYGLVQAEGVNFYPPESDEYYRYEFLAEVPSVLPAKARITIPYRITALKLHPRSSVYEKSDAVLQNAIAKKLGAKSSSSCSNYNKPAKGDCHWVCKNGEEEYSQFFANFFHLTGACGAGSTDDYNSPWPPANDAGGWGGPGGGNSSTPLPSGPRCTPQCRGACCAPGTGPGGGGGGGDFDTPW